MAVQDLQRIEDKIDKVVAGGTEVSFALGGVQFTSMAEIFEMAKIMAISGTAVPKHLRGNAGACLAVCIQALEWRMSPFAVANKSYEVSDRIAYEAQLVVGVINARAPLKERLRYRYEGEGPDMKCTVSGLLKGETSPHEYTSPKVASIKVKNSPLWAADTQQQLGYYSARAWARRHCPEVILGIYTQDELDEQIVDIGSAKPDVASRLKGSKGRGFNKDHVDAHTGGPAAITHQPAETAPEAKPKEPVPAAQPEPLAAKTDEPDLPPSLDRRQPKAAPAKKETPLERAARLLPMCRTRKEVEDLVASIRDEVDAAGEKTLAVMASARSVEF